jgi:hypothetical protein
MTAADGRARIIGVEHVDVQEHPDADHPYVLTTGRVGTTTTGVVRDGPGGTRNAGGRGRRPDSWAPPRAGNAYPGAGRARTCMRSPCGPKRVSTSAGSANGFENACGTRVSNSTTSPGASTNSRGPRSSRSRPEST